MISDQDLRRWGVHQPERVRALLDESGLVIEDLGHALEKCADIEQFALVCARAADQCPQLIEALNSDAEAACRFAAVVGFSSWWGDYLLQHPDFLTMPPPPSGLGMVEYLRQVLPQGWEEDCAGEDSNAWSFAACAMRSAYRRALFEIVADDLLSPDPCAPQHFQSVARRISDLADAALEAALYIAQCLEDRCRQIPLCVIAMGKTGGQELNYISDVDVMYVLGDFPAQQNGGESQSAEMLERATKMANIINAVCSSPASEAPLWSLDANLRPEGRDGALVRTLDSFHSYWKRWAQNWEFQALLKARPCTGDQRTGEEFLRLASPFIWEASARDGFVDEVRSMRLQVERSVPEKNRDQELKLGVGGLRDIEFSVQFLQLVHGRNDERIRQASTLDALEALSAEGYIARSDAASLCESYAYLRTLEHRSQLLRMHRTHNLPHSQSQLERLVRSLYGTDTSTHDLHEHLRSLRQQVRALHHSVFFRPIIAASAQADDDLIRLDPQQAMERLRALGYLDPRSAMGHIQSLSTGTSRRAMIQRHLLPVLLSWIADGANPDMGLLNFRVLSEEIGDSHWYLALLRDSDFAASQLCRVLSASEWLGALLRLFPEAVSWLDSPELLETPSQETLRGQMLATARRAASTEDAVEKIRLIRTREVLRIALREVTGSSSGIGQALSDVADVCLQSSLETLIEREADECGVHGLELCALGSYGAQELTYTSDLDVIAIMNDEASSEEASVAHTLLTRLKQLLARPSRALTVALDFNLRPEGKNGALVRSCDSYIDYYQKWAQSWEKQMLVRLRPLAGGPNAHRLWEFVQDYCYSSSLSAAERQEIQLMKVRVERERIPGGIDPRMHVKLGPGALSDIQWLVELFQLQWGYDDPSLRVASTKSALDALCKDGHLSSQSYNLIESTWTMAQRLRRLKVIATGPSASKNDVLPSNADQLVALAMLMGYSRESRSQMIDQWLAASRKVRTLFEKLFWDIT